MHEGITRFEHYLNQLQNLISASVKQKNPALWLYRNDARTPVFMLEGLAKLYGNLHNEKRFAKIKEHFKLFEDALGSIDHYDSIAKELTTNKKIPKGILAYIQRQKKEAIQILNDLLVKKGWTDSGDNRMVKIHRKLLKAAWLNEDAEIKAIEEFYGQAIYEIAEFVQNENFRFDNMETDVHELRRKLRWLSIYPRAVGGCIQLDINKPMPKRLKKYCIPEITNSPYNKMPDPGTCKHILLLETNYFYALSWMISKLGELKDKGLYILAIKEALQQTEGLNEESALRKTYGLLPKSVPRLEGLLVEAESICKVYFKEQNLEHLVIGHKQIG